MRTGIVKTVTVIAVAAALMAGVAAGPGAEVRKGLCDVARQPRDRVRLRADDPKGQLVHLHIETRKGRDWAWADAFVTDGGHL
ncbi:hypothetical protein ABZ723_04385 [Streptomyces sp. NPDC006700]|uniref:hypothetical protein n=1 Tax=Streptomyces sp. NPDC006700 TaxID=3154479 RepID=UPI0033EE093B